MQRWSATDGMAVWLAAGLVACHGDAERPPVALQTEHFRLHAYPDDWICPRFGERLEAHYAAVGGYLGATLPSGAKIDIYKFRDQDDFAAHSPCPDDHGCAGGREAFVYTLQSPLEHELVHVYTELWGDEAPVLFEEGLATMLQESDGRGVGQRPPDHGDVAIEALTETDAWRAEQSPPYGAAASFVRFVVDRHGIEAFRSFHSSTPRYAGRDDIERSFDDAFGESLAVASTAWRDTASASLGNGWLPIARCAAPPVSGGQEVEIDAFVCGRETRSLSLAAPQTLVVASDPTSDHFVNVVHCSGIDRMWPTAWSLVADAGQRSELWAPLDAGDYSLSASATSVGTGVVDGSLSIRWGSLVADRCEQAVVHEVSTRTRLIEIPVDFGMWGENAGDPDLPEVIVRIAVTRATDLTTTVHPPDLLADGIFEDGQEHRTHRLLCIGGCSSTDCAELSNAPHRLEPGVEYDLVLEGTPADRRNFELALTPA